MKFSILTLVSLLSITSFADTVIPAGHGEEAVLGAGFSSDTQHFAGRCLKGRSVEVGQPVANVDFTQSLSQSELANQLGFGAGGRFQYGAAEVGASAKFFQQQQSSSFSLNATYVGDYRFKNLKLDFDDSQNGSGNIAARLSDIGKAVLGKDQKWLETCGSEYVEQIERGAKLFYSIRIDFQSQEEKQVFEAAFSYESSYASVQAYLKNSSQNFSKKTKVTVSALQIGGDVSKVTELFGGTKDDQSAEGFIQCSFGDFSKCDAVMANALKYATQGFKAQLSNEPASPGAAYINYRTKKYSNAGYYGQLPSIVNLAIKNARTQLETFFAKQMDLAGEVRQMLYGKTVVLSQRQRDEIASVERVVTANLRLLSDAAVTCYDAPADCQSTISALADPAHGIQEIDGRKLVIGKETFMQFCSFAQSPVAPAKLRSSIEGMIKAAQRAEPAAFSASSDGRTDNCLIAHMVFSRASKMDFSNLGLSTLEPIQEYKNFVSIDLSNNEIEDLSPLARLDQLEVLNLHVNKVRDLAPLANLRSLKELRVSNNSLRTIDDLGSLPALVRIDARNNFPTVSCTAFSRVETCLSSSVRTDANFVAVATQNSVPFFMPSLAQMQNGDVLAVGMGDHAQLFDPSLNKFNLTGSLGGQTFAHASTALLDGRVLVTGGWGGLKRTALYSPQTSLFDVNPSGLAIARAGHQMTTLHDGRVLITGGWTNGASWTGAGATYTAEIFNPQTGASTTTSSMHAPRAWHTATLLDSGQVLIVGGFSHNGSLATAELFDPATDTFKVLSHSMSEGRSSQSATRLSDGRVLIAGGFTNASESIASAEIFEPQSMTFKKLPEPLNQKRGAHAAIRLANGKILITGGSESVFAPNAPMQSSLGFIDSGELFDPVENSFTQIPAKMFIGRANHSMVEIKPGLVLIVGGLSLDAAFNNETFSYTDIGDSK